VRIERHRAVIEEDLPGIHAYIAKHNPDAAERVLDAVDETFGRIAAQPECGVNYPALCPRLNGVRMLPVVRFNAYLVFYRITSESVRILYVVHGARHLPRLFGRGLRE
jgi:toxin ParE1/3/4